MISYAICVCKGEEQELKNLLSFLKEACKKEHEIVVLIDSSKNYENIRKILDDFPNVKTHTRVFDGNFAAHKNHLGDLCKGDVIFNIDADEIPQEGLVRLVEDLNENFDVIYVPRINICPGYTENFIQKHGFQANDVGWINWPDYQGRVYKKGLQWIGAVHEKIDGAPKVLPPNPKFALWHIKTTERQNRQNELYKSIQVPDRG